jgi:hypothetical protein
MDPPLSRQSATDSQVRIFPRRKIAGGVGGVAPEKGRAPLKVGIVAVRAHFGRPQSQAATELGLSLTALKQICRKLGVPRWPYQRPSKIDQARSTKSVKASVAKDASDRSDNAGSKCDSSCTEDTIDFLATIQEQHSDLLNEVEQDEISKFYATNCAGSGDDSSSCEGDDLSWMGCLPEDDCLPRTHYNPNWLPCYHEVISAPELPQMFRRIEPTPLFYTREPEARRHISPSREPDAEAMSQQGTAQNSPVFRPNQSMIKDLPVMVKSFSLPMQTSIYYQKLASDW